MLHDMPWQIRMQGTFMCTRLCGAACRWCPATPVSASGLVADEHPPPRCLPEETPLSGRTSGSLKGSPASPPPQPGLRPADGRPAARRRQVRHPSPIQMVVSRRRRPLCDPEPLGNREPRP